MHEFDEIIYRNYLKNKILLECVVASFFIICIAYGAKFLEYSYATDDYSRFYRYYNGFSWFPWGQTINLGRWFTDFLNAYIFNGDIHILPYWGTLFSLFIYSITGVITACIWEIKSKISIVALSVILVVTPFIAHNIYFNTNTSVSLAHFFAVVAAYFLSKKKRYFYISLIFLVLAIGTYQTVLQVYLIVIIGYIYSTYILKEKKLKSSLGNEAFVKLGLMVLLPFLAYLSSNFISEIIIAANGLEKNARFAFATADHSIGYYFNNVINVYALLLNNSINFLYWHEKINILLKVHLFLTFSSLIFLIVKYKNDTLKMVVIIATLILLPMVLHLPKILGIEVPARAYTPLGWYLAMSLFLFASANCITRNIRTPLYIITVIIFSLYISIFFDSAGRQTHSDIIRANQIVNRIRQHPQYSNEPVKFLIIGRKVFSVPKWNYDSQTALAQDWSKYRIFSLFTDFDFQALSKNRQKTLTEEILQSQNMQPYPARDSIKYYDGVFVLLLQ